MLRSRNIVDDIAYANFKRLADKTLINGTQHGVIFGFTFI